MSTSAYRPIRFALATALLVTTVLVSIIAQASAAPFGSRSVDLSDRFEAINAAIVEAQGWPNFDPSSLPDEGKSVTGPAPVRFATDADQDSGPCDLSNGAPASFDSFATDADQDPD